MFGLPLAFSAPLVLVALAALPVLYYLLRVTPPPPRREPLPTLPLVKDLAAVERQPSRTPWWLLALRLLLTALAILALAGPRWNPPVEEATASSGPLVILVDNGWTAAPDWPLRRDRVLALLDSAGNRPVAIRAMADDPQDLAPGSAQSAMERMRALQPAPHAPDRARQLALVQQFARTTGAEVIWLTDGIEVGETDPAVAGFVTALGARLTVIRSEKSEVQAIASASNENDALQVRLSRPSTDVGAESGLIRALDARGRLVGEASYNFRVDTETLVRIVAPVEARNDIVRVEIANARSAGAVHLLDAASQRRKVAIISGETSDTAQPLVSGAYFITKALAPYTSLTETPRGGDPVARALEGRPEVLVLLDIATLPKAAADQIAAFVEEGGVVIRFAGSGLAAGGDEFFPVRLRRGGRVFGGTLSWEKPQKLAAFSDAGPFSGLAVPGDVQIERQVLAEPEPTLNDHTWAALSDGTPLVTAARRGKGHLVLFHVTADTSWSNLPLSGVFVDMLRRILPLAASAAERRPETATDTATARRVLDGFGTFISPPPTAKPIARNKTVAVSAEHPPGFYGPPEATIALNSMSPTTRLAPLDLGAANIQPLDIAPPVDLRRPLLFAAFLLLLADGLAMLWLGGLFRRGGLAGAATMLAAALTFAVPDPAAAQQQPQRTQPTKQDIEASLNARLAYIITGNAQVDEASRLGLASLSRALANRTSFEPAAPAGLDPAKDELVFYSLIYWPMTPDQPMPSDAAMRAVDQFMKNGGTVIFDTRDASAIQTAGSPSAETRRLRQMLRSIDIPEIEQVPRDHVLTKTFYLLDRVIGRYAQGETWVEALPRTSGADKRPARAGDRVSPVVITSNDLAAAWAVDKQGQPLYPMVPGEPRQREIAIRSGINLVMYAMTGNYKADQVHIPALLERLGQ